MIDMIGCKNRFEYRKWRFHRRKKILGKHILEEINIVILNFEKIIGEKINNKFLEFLESNLIRLSPLYTKSYIENFLKIKYKYMKKIIEEYNRSRQNKMKEIEDQLMNLEKGDKNLSVNWKK